MSDNKDIIMTLDDEKKHIIPHDHREINAEQIYQFLDYKIGDTYTVETNNEHNLDTPVLSFFSDLMQDITNSVNEFAIPESEDEFDR